MRLQAARERKYGPGVQGVGRPAQIEHPRRARRSSAPPAQVRRKAAAPAPCGAARHSAGRGKERPSSAADGCKATHAATLGLRDGPKRQVSEGGWDRYLLVSSETSVACCGGHTPAGPAGAPGPLDAYKKRPGASISEASTAAPSTHASRSVSRDVSTATSPRGSMWAPELRFDFDPKKVQEMLENYMPSAGSVWTPPAQPEVPGYGGRAIPMSPCVPSSPSHLVRAPPSPTRPNAKGSREAADGRRGGLYQRVLGVGRSPLVRNALQRLESGFASRRSCSTPSAASGRSAEQAASSGHQLAELGWAETPCASHRSDVDGGSEDEVESYAGSDRDSKLWDLRCRLASAGVRLTDGSAAFVRAVTSKARPGTSGVIQRAVDQIKRLRTQLRRRQGNNADIWLPGAADREARDLVQICKVARKAQAAQEAMQPGAFAIESAKAMRLTSQEWLRLCKSLKLSEVEAHQLRSILGGCRRYGSVDMHKMFDALRAVNAPDISCERFASRLLTRFGSLPGAFDSVCPPSWPSMGITEFRLLCQQLGVNDGNGQRLWDLLSRSRVSVSVELPVDCSLKTESSLKAPEDRSVTRSAFVRQLRMWLPDTALDALMDQLCERFGSLAQGIHALENAGLERSLSLSAASLAGALLAIGIAPGSIDAERVLTAAALHFDAEAKWRSAGRSVSLEQIMQAMRALQRADCRGRWNARLAVCDDTCPLWMQLRRVRADLGYENDCHLRTPPRLGGAGELPGQAGTPMPESLLEDGSTPPHRTMSSAQKKRFGFTPSSGPRWASAMAAAVRNAFTPSRSGAVAAAEHNR
eukprot:TRINITY_DN45485_c0_g1_i1.p1 TRINITY_DN45485_c0_g1~~TRINITY_DN45485_c0_g1_i1.p1  ORF type:complete len:813 (+),score=136.29 TRINITY_DN45485_c0_g1_i1:110-2548(+)